MSFSWEAINFWEVLIMVFIPEIQGNLRKNMIRVPEIIKQVPGIKVFGKLIRSLVFTTDIVVIKNCNADAIIAVYPFTPQPIITHAIMMAADVPVFCGVGGGTTQGKRVVNLALDAEFQGAISVVLNGPTSNEVLMQVVETVDIPVVITVVSGDTDIGARLGAGAAILNVSCAGETPDVVRKIRQKYPEIPIMATGGPTDESIKRTIEAGANAITYTPPNIAEIFRDRMRLYRENEFPS
jgi:hypothetical protein